MRIELYKFGKKKNSTMRPDAQHAELLDGTFEKGQDICNPVIRIVTSGTLGSYNYAFIHELDDRYFFVNKIVSVAQGVTDLYLEVDPLATYKDEILKQTFYVSRSASDYDVRVIDRQYPTLPGNAQFTQHAVDWLVTPEAENHVYSIGVIGGKGTSGITYGLISEQHLRQLMTFMFTADNFSDVMSDEVVKTFFNPSQYISSCNYIPFNYSYYGQHIAQTIKLGWFETNVPYSVPQIPVVVLPTISIEIPFPLKNHNDFRNFSPFTEYRMLIPFIGYVPINSNLLMGNTTLELSGVCDLSTGQGLLRLKGKETGLVLTELACNMMPPVAIAQSHVNYSVASAVGGVMSLVGGQWDKAYDFGGDIAKKAEKIGDAALASQVQASTIGTQGNIGQTIFNSKVVFQSFRKSLVTRDLSDFGAPLMAPRQLKNLSGYCEVINAHFFSTQATEPERDAVNTYLEGGIYIE